MYLKKRRAVRKLAAFIFTMNSEAWEKFVCGKTTLDRAYISPINVKILEEFEKYFGEDRVGLSYGKYLTEADYRNGDSGGVSEMGGLTLARWESCSTLEEFLEPFRGRLRNIFITVHFPEVTIENEEHKSTKVKDLYVRVQFPTLNGGIMGTRTTYTARQLMIGYVHSHLPGCRIPEYLGQYNYWCLGSGPLVSTVEAVRRNLERGEDLSLIPLMCMEIDNLTKVESLRGGPYNRLSGLYTDMNYQIMNGRIDEMERHTIKTVGTSTLREVLSSISSGTRTASSSQLIPFRKAVKDYLKMQRLPFITRNGNIAFAAKFIDILVDMTNYIMSHASEADAGILKTLIVEVMVSGEYLYAKRPAITLRSFGGDWIGRPVFQFRGNPVRLVYDPDENDRGEDAGIKVFNPQMVFTVLKDYLDTVNIMYKSKS